jgi:hypothetical protein
MVSKHPFLDFDEALEIRDRLFQFRHLGLKVNHNHIYGTPVDSNYERKQMIPGHNQFMRAHFPELLERLKVFFEAHLGSPCFYADEISYPGFHIFQVLPHKWRPTWFHSDDVVPNVMREYPHFGVTKDSRQLTFTILLDAPPGLSSGLLYFTNHELGKKVMTYEGFRHPEFHEFATLHSYTVGEMNLYEKPVHSVFGKNDTDGILERVTVQGLVMETALGNLIFW